MVWSPPIVNTVEPSRRKSVIDVSIVSMASLISNGLTAISPQSATCWLPNGSTCRAGLYGRNNFEAART